MTDKKDVREFNTEGGSGCIDVVMVFAIVAVIALITIMVVFGGG